MAFSFEYSCEDLARIFNGAIIGFTNNRIKRLNRIEYSESGDFTFLSSPKYVKHLSACKASCILVPENTNEKPLDNQAYICVYDPYAELVHFLQEIQSSLPRKDSSIHPTAIIGENCKISESAFIGPYCVIEDNCIIENNVILHANINILSNSKIDSNTVIYPQVTIYSDTQIGSNCIIHSGAVIGSDGFGNLEHSDGSYEKIPQLGNVIIFENVEIGANSTVDRALIGSTIIEKGVKIDNMCQIAHNCIIGENTAMAAQVGISGSVKVGKNNRFGGQVGLAGHIETADNVTILAQSGVAKSVEKSGLYFGSPIKDRIHAFKIEAAINNLPDISHDVNKLKKIIEQKLEIKI